MGLSFEFAFLGPNHNYVASLTKTKSSGCLLEAATTAFFRMPEKFKEEFSIRATYQYMYNIRGHDFLSYTVQAINKADKKVFSAMNNVSYAEIKELQKLAAAHGVAHKRDLAVSFGPAPGAFFASAPRLRRYRWANLPPELDDILQDHVCRNGYGDEKKRIKSICMNSRGGWVVQVGRNNQVLLGGTLPLELENVLRSTLERGGPSVEFLAMNHQHPSEYVLVLDDGRVFCELHPVFKGQLFQMLKNWASGNNCRLELKWVSLPGPTEEDQSVCDAFYYCQRGWSNLQHGRVELAYEYFKEAHLQDVNNKDIRRAYARSLMLLRPKRRDRILEDHLIRGQPLHGEDEFKYQYVMMRDTIQELEQQEMSIRAFSREWSWISEIKDRDENSEPQELPLSPVETLSDDAAELEGRGVQ